MNRERTTMGVRWPLGSALAVVLMLMAAAAFAQTPQTIVIDGTNDFDPSNLLQDDSGDAQVMNYCTDDPEDDNPMDIGVVYITNDTNNLYIGFQYDRECFASPQVNLGIAFSYGAEADGSTTDAFGRKIAWNTITRKPDNYFYVVLDSYNYEAFYEWTGSAWANVSSTVNPSYGGGSNGLGMANDLGFEELSLPLSAFAANGEGGLQSGETLYLELWMTQDGTSKPPLDAVGSDDVQTSTPSGTTFDVTTAVEMTTWLSYVVQNASDSDAPVVTDARMDPFDATKVIVTFNEPVDQITAETAGNYSLVGSSLNVTGAVQSAATNIVTLALDTAITPASALFVLDVTGVEDLAGNALTGLEDDFGFAVKEVTFRGLFENYLLTNGTGTDGFTVEGSKEPLDFNLVADAFSSMTQVDAVNEIWENDVLFSWGVGPVVPVGKMATTFVVEWKFNHNVANWESIGNRILTLSADDPASQVSEHFWNDQDPSQFTQQDIDVVLTVDMTAVGPIPGDTIEVAGSIAPLSFTGPFLTMVDDGTGQDAVAGDNIFSAVVTFPTGSLKNVNYKYVFNGALECFGQGDRNVYLNDELFDVIGGTFGPIVMPLQTYDRCSVVAGDTELIFSVDLSNSIYDANVGASFEKRADTFPPIVTLAGDVAPLVFDPIASTLPMADNGVAPDQIAGDLIYTVSVVFPDSSDNTLEYKYTVNGEFEGLQSPNRFVVLADEFDASGNYQLLATDDIHVTQPTGVEDTPTVGRRAKISAQPNPFNPRTTVVFEIPMRGKVRVDIFDARGRLVSTLLDGELDAGQYARTWDGRTDDGRTVGSGVYFARVLTVGSAAATKLVLVK